MHPTQCEHHHWCRCGAKCSDRRGCIPNNGVTVTKLAMIVASPAHNNPVIEDCTVESTAGGDTRHRRTEAGYGGGLISVGCVTQAQLATSIVSPALHSAIIQEGTDVIPT